MCTNLYESKYYEFLLHHGIAFVLVSFCFYDNFWKSMACGLFLHDLSDVFLCLVRIYADYKGRNKTLTNAMFMVNLFFWVYSRIIYLPLCLISSLFNGYLAADISLQPDPIIQQAKIFNMFFFLLISTLLMMHIYWALFMIKSALYYNTNSAVKRYDVN